VHLRQRTAASDRRNSSPSTPRPSAPPGSGRRAPGQAPHRKSRGPQQRRSALLLPDRRPVATPADWIVLAGAKKQSLCSSNSAPFLDNTWDFRHPDCPYRAGIHVLTGVQWSHCHPMAASAKPSFINHLIDTIQHLFYNRWRAAGEPRESEPTNVHQNLA
jgi:hypothetical protein